MDAATEALHRHRALSRQASACGIAGALLGVLNVAYLSDELRYFTASSQPAAWAIYAIAAGLVAFGGYRFTQARALRAQFVGSSD